MIRKGAREKDLHWFRHVGTTNYERWYGTFHIQANGFSTALLVVGTLYALPFISARGGRLDRIAMNVTAVGAAGSKLRFGIYKNTADENLYPSTLVLDSGEFDSTTTGVKSASISQDLDLNNLYWFVCLCGTAAPTVRGGLQSSMPNIFGIDSGLGTTPGTRISVAQAYGALPATFPAGAVVGTGTPIPFVFVRYSA